MTELFLNTVAITAGIGVGLGLAIGCGWLIVGVFFRIAEWIAP